MRNGNVINERKALFEGKNAKWNRTLSRGCFGALCALVLGSWVGYFWGVATGNNE